MLAPATQADFWTTPSPARAPTAFEGATSVERASLFLESLLIPEGPKAGEHMRLAPFQQRFVRGALANATKVAVLSVGRGNAKSALSAGLALGALLGVWDRQPRRDVVLAARTRDQAKIAWTFAEGFSRSLPVEYRARLILRRSPRLEIEFEGDGGGHVLRAIAADGKTALGSAPTLAILDERGHWAADKGDALEAALLTGLGKRGGRALLISTSAPDDAHAFSRWIDAPPPGTFIQEHRPPPGLPADDLESLRIANPGAEHGVGASLDWLQESAKLAIARGGSTLSSFRLFNRNERVAGEVRDVLLRLDEWLSCETANLPERSGPVVVGLDLGGSSSMSAAALYWPETGRLEVAGTFPNAPTLLDRGQSDGVGARYAEMAARGELSTLGGRTVPIGEWIASTLARIPGQLIAGIVADRYKQAELGEAFVQAGVTAPIRWRAMAFKDSAEDIERFRRAVFDGRVKCTESLLIRSALADCVCIRDDAGNLKIAKGRSNGRIDPAAAAVLAVAEGARLTARRAIKPPRMIWA